MRRLLPFLLSFLMISVSLLTVLDSYGQNERITPLVDTLKDADTAYYVLPKRLQTPTAVVQLKVTRPSGTLAGSAFLQGSLNNSDWVALTSEEGGDTLTFTNVASVVKVWTIDNKYSFNRIRIETSGTVNAVPTGNVYWRRDPPYKAD